MTIFDLLTIVTLPLSIMGAINAWQTMRSQYRNFKLDIEHGTYYQEDDAKTARKILDAIEKIWWYPILLHIKLYWYLTEEELIIDGWIFHPWSSPNNKEGYRIGSDDR